MDPDVLQSCDITYWYKHPIISKITFPTIFVEIPAGLVERILSSQGLFLNAATSADLGEWTDDSNSSWSDEDDNLGAEDGSDVGCDDDLTPKDRKHRQQERFPEFEAQIESALKKWVQKGNKGGIFPRLNWSAPLDAHWMTIGGSCRCTTLSEVLSLLEASDAVRNDIELIKRSKDENSTSFRAKSDDQENAISSNYEFKPVLALRKWHEMHSPSEFRCFVKNSKFIAASQKDISNFWPFLVESRESNLEKLKHFFDKYLKDNMKIESYVFEAYIHTNGGVWLIDLAPFTEQIEPLLWTWDELQSLTPESTPSLRIVEHQTHIMPNLRKMASAVPFDLINAQAIQGFSSEDGNDDTADIDPNNIEEIIEKMKRITDSIAKQEKEMNK